MVFTVKSFNFIFEHFYGKILWKQVIGMVRKVGMWEEFMEDVAFFSFSSSYPISCGSIPFQIPTGLTGATKSSAKILEGCPVSLMEERLWGEEAGS